MFRKGLILIGVILGFAWKISGHGLCPRLQKPWNGQFIGHCHHHVGTQCVFQCREPYILVGSSVRTCRSDGTWSGTTAACELDGCGNCGEGNSNCVNLYNPNNGYTEGQCTPGIVGQVCQFQCHNGYSPEGDTRLTCLNGGRWSSMPPVCRRISAPLCQEIFVQNGRTFCTQEEGQTICRIVCDDGYMIVGSSVITCSSGEWNDQVPSCRREVVNLCPTLNAPEGGRLVGSCTAANTGDTCQLVCLSGYRPTDTRVLVCQRTGRWSDSLPRCVGDFRSCPVITISEGTSSGDCGPAQVGHICRITCNAGYILTGGSGTLICQANGEWSGTIPSCTARTCQPLAPPVYGGVSGTCSPGQVGQSCSFYCNSGYQLVGQSTLTCGNEGRWSGNPPYCNADTCPNLDPPANGGRSGSCVQATVGQSCSFSCQGGFVLNGQSTLVCQTGGRWSSSVPTCIRVTCPNLNAPANGATTGSCAQAAVGQSCTFSCNYGYTLNGQSTLFCQNGGQWSSGPPSCIRSDNGGDGGNCPVLTPPPNGDFLQCDNRPGGQCTVVCDKGFTRSGSRVRTCLTSGMWSGYAPTCTRTVGYTTYTKYKVVPLWTLVFG